MKKNKYLTYFSSNLILSSIIAVPSTTHVSGESAIFIGTFNSSSSSFFNPVNKAPPPVTTIPFVTISADNSGNVSSNTDFVASTIL